MGLGGKVMRSDADEALRFRWGGVLLCLALILSHPYLLYGQEGPQDRVETLLAGAEAQLRLGESDRAESQFREAAGLALNQLGVIYTALGRYDLAEQAHRQAAGTALTSVSSLLELAIVYLRSGQYDRGIETCDQILELNPLQAKARHILGKIHFLAGDFALAASQLQDSYQVDRGDASVAYTLALALLKLDQPDAAQRVFQEMEGRLGESPQLAILFGKAYRQAGLLERAVEQFRRAVALDPSFPGVHRFLGQGMLLWKGREAFQESTAALRRELESNPDSYFANFYLGLILSEERKYQEALPFLERAIQARPDQAEPHHYLGDALYGLGEVARAIQHLQTSIEHSPDPSVNGYLASNTHYLLGRALRDQGDPSAAERHLRIAADLKSRMNEMEADRLQDHLRGALNRGIREDIIQASSLDAPGPDEGGRRILENTIPFYRAAAARGFQRLARLFSQSDQLDRAEGMLARGFDWGSELPGIAFNLAVARLKLNDLPGAVAPMVEAYRLQPTSGDIRNSLANLAFDLVQQGNGSAAEPALTVLLEERPAAPELNFLMGQVQAQKGAFHEALAAYARTRELQPDFPELEYYSGLSLLRLGRLEDALASFEATLSTQSDHARALYHKAFVLVSLRRAEEAVPLLQRVVALDRSYADAYYLLGKAQLDLDQTLLGTANLEVAAGLDPTRPHSFFQLARAYRLRGREEAAAEAFQRYQELKRLQERRRLEASRTPPLEQGGAP